MKADQVATRRAAAEALVNLIQIQALANRRTRTLIGYTPLRNEVILVGTAVVKATVGGLDDRDVEVRRQCAGAIHESAVALADLVVDVPARGFFPPEGRQWNEDERRSMSDYENGVKEEQSALKALLTSS